MTLRTRHIAASLLSALILFLPSCIGEDSPTANQTTLVNAGDNAPNFTVEMLDGSSITLSDLRGRVVLLTFWSHECSMCRAEIAVVRDRIIDRFEGEEFTYLPVSRGLPREAVESFCEQNGYDFPIGIDPSRSIYSMYATKYVPHSFLVDRNGIVRLTAAEYEPEYLDTIAEQARHLLATQ